MDGEQTKKQLEPPAVPEGAGAINQRAATPEEQRAIVESAATSGTVLGKDIALDLTALVSQYKEVAFPPAAIAFCNALLYALKDSKDRTESALTEEQRRNDALRDRAADAERDAAVFKSERDAARRESNFRQLIGTVGGAVLGFMPYAIDKAGAGGGVLAGVVGLALAGGAWLFREKT